MSTMERGMPPLAFMGAVRQAVMHLSLAAHDPLRVTVRFGDGAMERLPAELLGCLFAIREAWGVPVEFPEEPAAIDGLIEITAVAEHKESRILLTCAALLTVRFDRRTPHNGSSASS